MFKQFFFIMLVITTVGCSSARPTVGNSTTTETKQTSEQSAEKSSVESVIDSTLIDRLRETITKNDTVYIKDSVYIIKWRDRVLKDTVEKVVKETEYINKTDTITNTIEIEKPIAPFVRNSCIALWSIIGVAILALVAWIVWSFATGKLSWAKILTKLIGIGR